MIIHHLKRKENCIGIAEVNRLLQAKISELDVSELEAVPAAKFLDETGLLKDSKHRPGLPLRKLLRAGKITGAYQYPNRRWVIRRTAQENIFSVKEVAKELGISENAIYKRIEKGLIGHEVLGEKILVIPESEILREQRERTQEVDEHESGNIRYEISKLKQTIQNIKDDLEGVLARIIVIERMMNKTSENQTFTSVEELQNNGFEGFKTVKFLRQNSTNEMVDVKGIYLVLYLAEDPPEFLDRSKGGHFKANDPTVSVDILREKWINSTIVVYIGQAGGGTSKATLKSRIRQLLDFGNGKAVGHWGGRYLWQIKDSDKLVVCWKPYPDNDPKKVESDLIRSFIAKYGTLPFANLK